MQRPLKIAVPFWDTDAGVSQKGILTMTRSASVERL